MDSKVRRGKVGYGKDWQSIVWMVRLVTNSRIWWELWRTVWLLR